jgi:hypothetical protein
VKTTTDMLEDRQAAIGDIKRQAQELIDALTNAECCETPDDFDANVKEARDLMKSMAEELEEVSL